MANIKSAIKRNKQNEKRRVRNRVYRGRARTYVSKARNVIANEESNEVVMASVLEAVKALDTAASKGVIHKNNAARRKSRLMKRLSSLQSESK